MGSLEGRVAAITGAGRGIGREHALLFAAEGAKVVVNDLGGTGDGSGSDGGPAHEVVAEIEAAGGEAAAHTDDISTWAGAESLVATAVDAFGRLDVLVNNAGILRDAFIASMTEEQWDAVIKVHMKGHFCALHHAAVHWKERSKAGEEVDAAVINTASGSGTYLPNAGQVNYGAAKAGIAAMALVAAQELGRYGVTANAIAVFEHWRVGRGSVGQVAARDKQQQCNTYDEYKKQPAVVIVSQFDTPLRGTVFATPVVQQFEQMAP